MEIALRGVHLDAGHPRPEPQEESPTLWHLGVSEADASVKHSVVIYDQDDPWLKWKF